MKKNIYVSSNFNKLEDTNLQFLKTKYLVNNIFVSNLQPKRSSFDIKTFLQLYRKKNRNKTISKQFQNSMMHLNSQEKRKGFKGRQIHTSSNRSRKQILSRFTERNNFKTISDLNIGVSNMSQTKNFEKQIYYQDKLEDRKILKTRQKIYHKPNLMYNLSLYRKKYKKSMDYMGQRNNQTGSSNTLSLQINN